MIEIKNRDEITNWTKGDFNISTQIPKFDKSSKDNFDLKGWNVKSK